MLNIMAQILDGQHDDNLTAIVNAVHERRNALSRIRMTNISINDTIRFTSGIRPTYLAGLTAKVRRVNGKSVVVDIDADPKFGRFAGKRNVRCPASVIERVRA